MSLQSKKQQIDTYMNGVVYRHPRHLLEPKSHMQLQ